MKRIVIIIAAIFIAASIMGSLKAETAAPAAKPGVTTKAGIKVPNTKCLICHDPEVAEKQKSPPVDTHALRTQIHKDLTCVDCHTEAAAPIPDQPVERPHIKMMPRVTCNTKCHLENGPGHYKDSIHGRLARELGDKDVARCQDCHGDHDVARCSDPTSKVARCNLCQGCAKCHENQQLVLKHNIHQQHPCLQWELSVHGKPRMVDGKLTVPAVCTDCHGVHDIQGMGGNMQSAKQPQTCGKCHPKELKEYTESIHGREAIANNNPDAPLCVDCHGEHNILAAGMEGSQVSHKNVPDTCASCHARPTLMKKYGIEPNKVNTFINSFHGIAIGLNNKAVATCASCHGHHFVLPANDPKSSVNPNNLQKTCGQPQCHPKMPQSIKNAKIHVDYNSPKSGAIYWVRIALVWSLILLIVVSIIWVIPDIMHRNRLRKLGKKADVKQKS